jgi:Tol biopolymer transport system component
MVVGPWGASYDERTVRLVAIVAALLAIAIGAGVSQSAARSQAASAPIAFTVRDGGITKLYVIRPDGSGLRQLTPGKLPKDFLGDLTPAWSPDAQSIVFSRNTGRRVVVKNRSLGFEEIRIVGERLNLFRIAADGGRPTELTRGRGVYQATPAYSPDGKTIVYVESDAPGVTRGYVWAMPAKPSDDQKPAFANAAVPHDVFLTPRYSPDGQTLVSSLTLTAGEEGQWPVAPGAAALVAARSGDQVYGLGPNGLAPTWSPDGRHVAWVALSGPGRTCYRHANLGRLLLGLGPSRPGLGTGCLDHGELYTGELTKYRPNDEFPQILKLVRLTNSTADDESPSWSPDGTEIAYASGSKNAGLFAINPQTHKERLIYRPKRGAVTWVAWAPR